MIKTFDCVDHSKLWEILKEMGIPDHLLSLLRNLYAGQRATLRTRHGTTNWIQVWKWVHQVCILSPCLFNLHTEYIIWNARLDEAQAEIKISGRNISNLRWHHPYDRNWRETKEILGEGEGEEWRIWLKTEHSKNKDHGIQFHHFMANR